MKPMKKNLQKVVALRQKADYLPDVMLNRDEVLEMLATKRGAGTTKDLAAKLDVSPQYLNDVLHGRRDPGESILLKLGLEKVVSYRKAR